jgi:DNA-binding NarL/FixJ family response regulator
VTAIAKPVRVVLVDDQVLLRKSLALLIHADPELAVVGEAGDGVEAVEVAVATIPDVVLMDVRMPRLDGIEATRRICRNPALASTRVLVLSMFELDEYVYHALQAGASGFLLKDSKPADLINAIKRTHEGEALFAPPILTRLIEQYIRTPAAAADWNSDAFQKMKLTEREIEVLGLVGRGLSNEDIARQLTISIKTVKSHISSLLRKMEARDRVHLVIAAYDAGLVTPRSPFTR